MEKVRVLIVEDHSLTAEDVAGKLRKHDMEVVGICDSGEDAVRMVKDRLPDLVLMDIKLSGDIDGIEAGRIIKESFNTPIIFLSDYFDAGTIDRAKKIFPANYLSKPFLEHDLIRALDLAFFNTKAGNDMAGEGSPKSFFFKDSYKYIKVDYEEIILLRAERSYCTLFAEGRNFTFSKSMNNIAAQLNHPNLMRIHRSYMVNVDKITSINGNIINLGEYEAEVSRSKREEFFAKLRLVK